MTPIGQDKNVGFRYFRASLLEGGVSRRGWASELSVRQNARNLRWGYQLNAISPEFDTELGFIERVDQIRSNAQFGYRWWPESWITSWGPGFNFERQWNFDGVRTDQRLNPNINVTFANNININGAVARMMERFRGVEFHKTRYWINADVNTNRRIQFAGNFGNGDQVRFVDNPFLGRLMDYGFRVTLRPFSRLESQIRMDGNRFTDPRRWRAFPRVLCALTAPCRARARERRSAPRRREWPALRRRTRGA
jgi:hypothetical protein